MNSSKLKGIRVEKGKTQKNMAELIGKSLVTYSKKERGEVEFSNEEMWELKNCYTLDEALKLYALYRMEQDVEAGRVEDMAKEVS